MPDNTTADVDILARIRTEADNKGVEEARDAIDSLQETSTTATDKQQTAAKDTAKAEEQVTEAVKETDKARQEQIDTVEAAGRKTEELQDKTTKAAADQVKHLDEVKARSQAVSQAMVEDNSKVLQSLKWMQSGWVKFAAVAGAAFGAIGLVTQGINLLKQAWDWYNKDAIEAEQRRLENLEKQKEKVKELRQAYIDAAIQQRNADTATVRQYKEENRAKKYDDEVKGIERVNDALIRQAQLKAALDNNQDERARIELEEKIYRGMANQVDMLKQQADRTYDQRESQRGVALAGAQSQYDKAWTQEDKTGRQLSDKISDREGIVNDSRYMSKEEYAHLNKNIAETNLNEMELSQIIKKLGDKIKLKKNLYRKLDGTYDGSDRDEIDSLERNKSYYEDQIKKHPKGSEEYKRVKDFEKLAAEKGFEGKEDGLHDQVTTYDTEIKALSESLAEASEAAKTYKEELDNLKKIQEGERDNDNQERRYQQKRIDDDESKRLTEENKSAMDALRTEAEQTSAALKDVAAKFKEARTQIAAQADDFKDKGDWAIKVKNIAGKDQLSAGDASYLDSVKSKLEAAKGTGGDEEGRNKMIMMINQLVSLFESEKKASDAAIRKMEEGQQKIVGLENKGKADNMRKSSTDVLARVKDVIAEKRKTGQEGNREGAVDKTIAELRKILADNRVDKKDNTALNSMLQQWLAEAKAHGEDDVNTSMINLIKMIISEYKAATQKIISQADEIKGMSSELQTARAQFARLIS